MPNNNQNEHKLSSIFMVKHVQLFLLPNLINKSKLKLRTFRYPFYNFCPYFGTHYFYQIIIKIQYGGGLKL